MCAVKQCSAMVLHCVGCWKWSDAAHNGMILHCSVCGKHDFGLVLLNIRRNAQWYGFVWYGIAWHFMQCSSIAQHFMCALHAVGLGVTGNALQLGVV